MKQKKKIKLYIFEKRILELLGVCFFRKLVFLLEKIIHFKDGGNNINYHIKRNSRNAANDFKKFLMYNASIHVRNLCCFALIFTLSILLHRFKMSWYWIIFLIFAVKDLYCIFLQRYNFIRIILTEHRCAKIERSRQLKEKEKIRCSLNNCEYAQQEKEKDLRFIRDLIQRLDNNTFIEIDSDGLDSIQRLNYYIGGT